MTVGQLVALLSMQDQSLAVTVLRDDGDEFPLAERTVTMEGGGAAPMFVAINVEGA